MTRTAHRPALAVWRPYAFRRLLRHRLTPNLRPGHQEPVHAATPWSTGLLTIPISRPLAGSPASLVLPQQGRTAPAVIVTVAAARPRQCAARNGRSPWRTAGQGRGSACTALRQRIGGRQGLATLALDRWPRLGHAATREQFCSSSTFRQLETPVGIMLMMQPAPVATLSSRPAVV